MSAPAETPHATSKHPSSSSDNHATPLGVTTFPAIGLWCSGVAIGAAGDLFRQSPVAIAIAVAGLFCGAWSFQRLRGVDRWLRTLHDFARQLQGGDFTARMPIPRDARLHALAEQCNTVGRTMARLLALFSRLTHELASVAGESSNNAVHGGKSAESQRDVTHSSAAAVEEFSNTVHTASDLAAAAASEADRTGQAARHSVQVVERLQATLEHLADTVAGSARHAHELAEGSREIEAITALIADIAEQTNLLSLNASIEAARAGDSGRGFAVVAEEVRKLADRTATATRDIDALIRRLRGDVEAMEGGMRTTGERATASVRDAALAVSALHDMAGQCQATRDMVQGIAEATAEQTIASQRIAGDVERVAELADRNDALSRDGGELARYLEQLAGQLRDALTRYCHE